MKFNFRLLTVASSALLALIVIISWCMIVSAPPISTASPTNSVEVYTKLEGCNPPTIYLRVDSSVEAWTLIRNEDTGQQWLLWHANSAVKYILQLESGKFDDMRTRETAILENGRYVIKVLGGHRPDMNAYPTDKELEEMELLQIWGFRLSC